MERLRRFNSNAGLYGVLSTIVVSVAIVVLLVCAVNEGLGWYASLGVLVAVLTGYALNNVLARNAQSIRYIMNAIVVCIVAALWIFPDAYDLDWVKVVAPIGASLYLSCYFWLLSHPRIVAKA